VTIGRPSKLTPVVKERFIKALKNGAHIKTAAESAGVSYATICQWMSRGKGTHPTRKKTEEYVSFVDDVTRAIADAEMILISRVNNASLEDWRAAAWILPRRHPERWSDKHRLEREATKQASIALSTFFDTVMSDDTIPSEAKAKLLEQAVKVQAELMGNNTEPDGE
jgi:hypothetical protein